MVGDDRRDAELLAELDSMRGKILGQVGGVPVYRPGVYLWGAGGIGKSHTVVEALEGAGRPYKVHNTRLSARGLFEQLDAYHGHVHVLDDVERLVEDKDVLGMLKAALGSLGRRRVTWSVKGKTEEVFFTGGVVIVSNEQLRNVPGVDALASRMTVLRFAASPDHLAAQIRRLARKGYSHPTGRLEPAACREVADRVIHHAQAMGRPLNLRLYLETCGDRLQQEHGEDGFEWEDMLVNRLHGRVLPSPRAERRVREEDLARDLAHLPRAEKLAKWTELTGKSQASLYRYGGSGRRPRRAG